jgi:putative DNA primase/helicase
MYERVPDELKHLNQWVCWQSVPDDSRPGKIKKVPINPSTGGQAMSNNPDTWSSFFKAVSVSDKYSGIGFMFAGGYFGVDIDSAEDAIEDYQNGDTDNIIGEFIHTLQSYAEYSVSGKGLHILCRGTLPPGGKRRNNVEMYDATRYFIVTGNIASEYTDIKDCTAAIRPLHEKYIGGGQAPTTGIKPAIPLNLSEAEIIRMAENSKQGQTFTDLFAGRWESYFTSQSEADMSLCSMLAFWCRRDEQLMDKLFRQSGLMRPKWDRKQAGSTYGAITISKAAKTCQNIYEPQAEYHISFGTTPKTEAAKPRIYTFDDTGNSERFFDRFGESVLYNYTAKKWMYFDGRRWVYDENGETKRMADEIAEEMRAEMIAGMDAYLENLPPDVLPDKAEEAYRKHVKNSRSSKAKTAMLTEAQHRVPVVNSALDTHNSLLCVLNGELNLRTGSLQPHDKKHLISKITHTEYTDKIDHPLWDHFLADIFDSDQDLIRYVQKAIGYSLTGSTSEQCAFFLYGTGRNGKSTFLDIVTEIMGDYAINIQPETIMLKQASSGPTSDIARLKGARFVTTVEPNEGARLNEGLLKQLTGGDKVTAANKYENEFEFMPEFKLWMGTNHKPFIRGTDVGIWRRIHLIPFNVQIPENQVDKQLKFKLRQELPGILAWAVDGCLLWQREGLKPPLSVTDASKEYKTEMDVLASFLDECCDDGGEVGAGELFKAYIGWAKEGNEYEMSSTKFGREMQKRYLRKRANGSFFIGLHLRTAYKPYSVTFSK